MPVCGEFGRRPLVGKSYVRAYTYVPYTIASGVGRAKGGGGGVCPLLPPGAMERRMWSGGSAYMESSKEPAATSAGGKNFYP